MNTKKSLVAILVVMFSATGWLAGGEADEGKQIFDKLIVAMGGAKKIANLKTIWYDVEVSSSTPSGPKTFTGEITMAYPDKLNFTIRQEQGNIIQIINGAKGLIRLPNQTRPMSEKGIQDMQSIFYRDFFYIAQHLQQYKIRLVPKSGAEADDGSMELAIEGPAGPYRCRIDPRTHLARKAFYQAPGENGRPVEMEEVFSDYREVDGITMYFLTERYIAGKLANSFKVVAMKINPPVKEDLFLTSSN